MKQLLSALLLFPLIAFSQTITFDLANQKPITTKIGACLYESDSEKFPIWQDAAVAIGFQTYYYSGQSPYNMNPANREALQTLLAATGAELIAEYPFGMPLEYLDYLITLNPKVIQLARERLDIPAEEYIAWCNPAINYAPEMNFSYNGGDIWRIAPRTFLRNIAIRDQPDSFDVQQYNHLSPDRVVFTNNQNDNALLIDGFFNFMLPKDLADFKSFFPGRKQNIIQWHNEDYPIFKLSDALNNYAVGKRVEFVLNNTDNYSYLFWMEMKNLFQGQYTNRRYDHLKRVVPLFEYHYVIPVTIDIPGVTVTGFSTGNEFALLIINNTSTKHTITKSNIDIGGNTIVGNFSRDCGWAQSWNSALQQEITEQRNIIVRKNCVEVITFGVQ